MIWREISSWRFSFWLMGSSRRAARRRMNQMMSGTRAARRARTEAVIFWIYDLRIVPDRGSPEPQRVRQTGERPNIRTSPFALLLLRLWRAAVRDFIY